jgi:hypothetical protein
MPGFILCGEGPTDLYYNEIDRKQGPLKDCVDRLLDFFWDYRNYLQFKQVSRTEISLSDKGKPEKKTSIVRGNKNKFPNHHFIVASAKCLAQKAEETAMENDEPHKWGVIYFHDLDANTNASVDEIYNASMSAMNEGFDSASFPHGVPMIPKTRSESWLLCLLDSDGGRNAKYFEDLPMSDKSPNSGKKVLAALLNVSENESYSRIEEKRDTFDWTSLQAPSFLVFRDRLKTVSAKLLNQNERGV